MSPTQFYDSLRAYCAATGASVTSLGRTVTHNERVGGIAKSNHLIWRAADVVYDVKPSKTFRDTMARRFGLEVVEDKKHDHIEPISGGF